MSEEAADIENEVISQMVCLLEEHGYDEDNLNGMVKDAVRAAGTL